MCTRSGRLTVPAVSRLLPAWFPGLLRFLLARKASYYSVNGAAGLLRIKQGRRHLDRAPGGMTGGGVSQVLLLVDRSCQHAVLVARVVVVFLDNSWMNHLGG